MPLTDSQERYVNFYTDFAFKKLFGTDVNKELLISFLNSLFDGVEVIKNLKHINTEKMGAVASERKAVFDVYCENEKGERFIIEMQKADQTYFIDRSIYYSTFAIQDQAPKGKWNFKLDKVYTIGILNFIFDDKNTDYMHHEVKLMYVNTKELFFDKLTYVYLEMPKFRKTEDELVTILDKWLYAIKNLNHLMDRPKALVDAVFERFFEQAEIAKLTQQELHDYRESQKDYWDMFSVVETAENKGVARGREEGLAEGLEQGREEGRAEGLEQGREEGRVEGLEQGRVEGLEQGRAEGLEQGREEGERLKAIAVAASLLSMEMSLVKIARVTGLSVDEIKSISV